MAQQERDTFIDVINAPTNFLGDLYHVLLRSRWWAVLCLIGAMFLVVNVAFAFAFMWVGGVTNAEPGSFIDAFYFSVQTLGTIGYGSMYPATHAANLIVSLETIAAVIVSAISTGLVFAKFSMPRAQLVFSKNLAIFRMDGLPTLTLRIANERANFVVEAEIRMTLSRRETTREGNIFYRMYDLALVRSHAPALGRSWTVMHRIDAASPLHDVDQAKLVDQEAELAVSVLGIDGTSAQTIHANWVYDTENFLFGKRHADMLHKKPNGRYELDYAKFNDMTDAPL
ncbi:MAG: ATP-sensitive inward rectifier potassium channel 10 [Deltaproteobacteria bacterium]|nr:ATP-sensitive inward rectifier potassium channel 10 [Deltaproteobacteria bacterium]